MVADAPLWTIEFLSQTRQPSPRGARPRARAALHESLEIVRGVFTGKEHPPLAHFLVISKLGVLGYFIGAVAAQRVGIAQRHSQSRRHNWQSGVLQDHPRIPLRTLARIRRLRGWL